MSKCYCKNWICCCLLRSSISPKRIKLESCGCAQKKRLEILFPDLIKFLSFQWGGVDKIWDQKCAFFLKQFYVSFTLTHWWKSQIWSKTANRSVSRPIFLDSARPRASKLLLSKLFQKLLLFLLFQKPCSVFFGASSIHSFLFIRTIKLKMSLACPWFFWKLSFKCL